MKNFEWDDSKKHRNLEKHGIDFIDALKVFDDRMRVEFESARSGEKRYQTIGCIEDVVILVVYTYRSEKRRIISARMASKRERKVYEQVR